MEKSGHIQSLRTCSIFLDIFYFQQYSKHLALSPWSWSSSSLSLSSSPSSSPSPSPSPSVHFPWGEWGRHAPYLPLWELPARLQHQHSHLFCHHRLSRPGPSGINNFNPGFRDFLRVTGSQDEKCTIHPISQTRPCQMQISNMSHVEVWSNVNISTSQHLNMSKCQNVKFQILNVKSVGFNWVSLDWVSLGGIMYSCDDEYLEAIVDRLSPSISIVRWARVAKCNGYCG